MKKGWKIFWISIGVIASIGVVSLFGAAASGVSLYDVTTQMHVVEVEKEDSDVFMHNQALSDGEMVEYSQIKELQVQVDGCRVMVQTDHEDTVRIDSSALKRHKIDYEVHEEEGKLIVQAVQEEGHHFGKMLGHKYGVLKITVPEDMVLDGVEVDVEAGEAVLTGLKTLSLGIGAEAGEVEFTGEVKGDIRVDVGAGEVELLLDGKEADYNFDLQCQAGEVEIGALEMEGLGLDRRIDNNGEYNVDISCEAGSVSVEFR